MREKKATSRVCVKNLAKNVTLSDLKTHFSQIGELTDAKLLYTREGKSRCMGFVGYRTEEQAEAAIKFLNRSCLGNTSIKCEVGWINGDPNIPRPWSRHSKKEKKPANKIRAATGKKNDRKINEIDDPKLQEFLQVMRPCSNRKFWANDLQVPLSKQACSASDKPTLLKQQVCDDSLNKPDQSAQKENVEHPADSRKMTPDYGVTLMDYFKSRLRKNWSDSESDNDADGPAQGIQEQQYIQGYIDSEEQRSPLKNGLCDVSVNLRNSTCLLWDANKRIQTGRLYVWNLPYAATENEVVKFFNKFGNVKEVHLVNDKETKQPRGFGFVLYNSPEEAARALGDHTFQGRILHVIAAENEHAANNIEIQVPESKAKTYKQQREEKRKASEANGDTRAWNSLFMRTDTIVENIARKYGVSKSVLLDPEADDVAVRIALGETKIIAETKRALTNAGVNVASLDEFACRKSEGAKRSNHVILVKNLPFSSSKGELSEMFGRFGSLDKVIFPATRTLALVSFIEVSEARAAFNSLRYKRYRDTLLYLEWAPSNIFCQECVPNNDSKNDLVDENEEAKKVLPEQQFEDMDQGEFDLEDYESRTLYVKNLDFGTTDERLGKHFRENMSEGKILSARVVKHLKDGKHVSSGYGFVEFDSVNTITNVYRALQGTKLDGHLLDLQLSRPKKSTCAAKKADGRSSTTLIVKNVPFEARKEEIRQLFCPFGQVKSMRLPKQFGKGMHRGFAFVEYCTKQEAQNALEALSRTHFYGRPMVIERAKQEESLEELRAKTATQFGSDGIEIQNPVRVSKKRKIA